MTVSVILRQTPEEILRKNLINFSAPFAAFAVKTTQLKIPYLASLDAYYRNDGIILSGVCGFQHTCPHSGTSNRGDPPFSIFILG